MEDGRWLEGDWNETGRDWEEHVRESERFREVRRFSEGLEGFCKN